jgi:TetR/AcrR family transcriptional repressor of nem operon
MSRPSKRLDLLEKGRERVHHAGFSATSVADIAEAAGAPKGSFYNHFKSKEDFGLAILDHYFEEVRGALAETLHAGGKPALARIRKYFVRLRNYVGQEDFARGCLIGNISAEVASVGEATRARLSRLISEWTASLARCIEDGQRDGSIRKDVGADALASMLLDAWQGALLRAKVERLPAALDNFLDVLLPNLAKGRSPDAAT